MTILLLLIYVENHRKEQQHICFDFMQDILYSLNKGCYFQPEVNLCGWGGALTILRSRELVLISLDRHMPLI